MRYRAKALLRSLGLYKPLFWLRWRVLSMKMQAFYRQFIAPNDLVFDVGANIGNYTAVFLKLGARTLAIEPQTECVAQLKARFDKHPRAALYIGGVAAQAGTLELHTGEDSGVASFSPEAAAGLRELAAYHTYSVPVTTLDALIAEHGVPTFIKIDVEGYELPVLQGLSQPVQALSFEYMPNSLEKAAACLDYLATLGNYEFNAVYGATFTFMQTEWTDSANIQRVIANFPKNTLTGDVYARLKGQ